MRVRLFHTIPEEGRTSSEVYARELTGALSALAPPDLELRHSRPKSRLRRRLGAVAPAARLAAISTATWCTSGEARSHHADVYHLVDHGYGHLDFSLDRHRTIATFHDAMLLKFRARELPVEPYPHLSILAHRVDLVALAEMCPDPDQLGAFARGPAPVHRDRPSTGSGHSAGRIASLRAEPRRRPTNERSRSIGNRP